MQPIINKCRPTGVFILTSLVYLSLTSGQFSWIRQPRNLTAVIGSDVFIPCEFSGVGHIRPYWRHNNNELFHTLDLPPGYSFNNSGLIINEIMASMNMSSYSCYLDLFDGAQESSVGYITLVEVSVAPTAVTVLPLNIKLSTASSRLSSGILYTYDQAETLSSTLGPVVGVIHGSSLLLTNYNNVAASKNNNNYDIPPLKGSGSDLMLNEGIMIVIVAAGIVLAGVFICLVGITFWSRKHKRKGTVVQDEQGKHDIVLMVQLMMLLENHIYEEPSQPEPVYEELSIKHGAQATTSNKDRTGDLETDMNVAYQTTASKHNNNNIMAMIDCPAYQ